MFYLQLFIAIVGEIIGTTSLKYTEGFTKLGPTLMTFAAYAVTFYFLSLAMSHNVPTSVIYAIWSGVGIVLLTIISVLVFHQAVNLPTLLGLGLIIIGVVLVNLYGSGH
ncbi:small multidrug resistance pump [Weissella uvarum]|uniref:DMT family transporter n=1 Tax=Weissella uvarum TaxID=1479233 RepID=UPI00195F6D23|nr:multidrug efflux SMR transporter [Weissella uvarum]MBM7617413.1 small multidrug resistance pump [Weissella uvarum]MCM0595702.1 multidrug efflux SMR transporter [Weissella uvarum]